MPINKNYNFSSNALSTKLGREVSSYATRCATNKFNPDYLKLSEMMCWDAVLYCIFKADAIKKNLADKLIGKAYTEDSSDYMEADCTIVGSAGEMMKVPQGSLLGFFREEGNNSTLIHAMLATGAGCAAGNKNGCVGIGGAVGWEILDIANTINWMPLQREVNIVPKGKIGTNAVRLRYKSIESFCDRA